MLDWDGEGLISYRDTLIETKRFDLIEKFLNQIKESSNFIPLNEYLNTFDIEIYETIVENYKKQSNSISLEVFTVADMIESNHPLFNASILWISYLIHGLTIQIYARVETTKIAVLSHIL